MKLHENMLFSLDGIALVSIFDKLEKFIKCSLVRLCCLSFVQVFLLQVFFYCKFYMCCRFFHCRIFCVFFVISEFSAFCRG